MLKEILIPDIGNNVTAIITDISVSENMHVEKNKILCNIEVNKATVEILSPYNGEIKKINISKGSKIVSGELAFIVKINNDKMSMDDNNDHKESINNNYKTNSMYDNLNHNDKTNQILHASPAVRKFARELGLNLTDTVDINIKKRISKDHIKKYIKILMEKGKLTNIENKNALSKTKIPLIKENVYSLSEIQKVSSSNICNSWKRVPHVTQFDYANITNLNLFRKSKKHIAESLGFNFTILSFIVKACTSSLMQFPRFNSTFDPINKEIKINNSFNIGIVIDTKDGILVPIVHNVEKKGLMQIAKEIYDLKIKACSKKITRNDLSGGCFTISNLGMIDSGHFTPIIKYPEVGILGISGSKIKQIFNGKAFENGTILPLSLSYDHRVIDGMYAVKFIQSIKSKLSDISELLL